MKKKVVLPIIKNVPVYTYSYYAYPLSIIAAEERVGDCVVKFEVADYDKHQWTEQLDTFRIVYDENCFELYTRNPYKGELNGVISRPLEMVDAIRVRIYYQQYTCPWGAINLFIDDAPEMELKLGDDDYLYRLGFFNREGIYFRVNNQPKKLNINQQWFPVDLMLCRDKEIVEAYLCDGEMRYLLCQTVLRETGRDILKIGIQIKENENTYYHWLYRNFIQISCDVTDVNRPIDYLYSVERNWRFDSINYFITSNETPLHLINEYGVLRFIKECIDEGKYLELLLDQYYIPERTEFHCIHYLHQNLIYGYNDHDKIFYLLGYTNNGKLSGMQVSYSDIKYQFSKRKCVRDIYVLEYEQDGYSIEYHKEYIIKMIKQYLIGYNSSYDIAYLIEPRKRIYGMKCYNVLLSDEGMERLLTDRRILHLFYEHKSLMKDRLSYLKYYGAIEPKAWEEISTNYDEVVRIAFNIRSLSVKYSKTGDNEIIKKIKAGLKDMQIIEEKTLFQVVQVEI